MSFGLSLWQPRWRWVFLFFFLTKAYDGLSKPSFSKNLRARSWIFFGLSLSQRKWSRFFLLFGANGVRRIEQTELFEKSTGKKLDVLWAEYVATQVKVGFSSFWCPRHMTDWANWVVRKIDGQEAGYSLGWICGYAGEVGFFFFLVPKVCDGLSKLSFSKNLRARSWIFFGLSLSVHKQNKVFSLRP